MRMSEKQTSLIPWPRTVRWGDGELELTLGARIVLVDEADRSPAALLTEALGIVSFGQLRCPVVVAGAGEPDGGAGDIVFRRVPGLKPEHYRLRIDDRVLVEASGPEGFFRAAATLTQSLRFYHTRSWLPRAVIDDEPFAGHRGLMIDVARHPHTPATLQQLVRLCWFYKIRYLQLHLSDVESFAFPSTAFPKLATPGWGLTLAQWQALEAFAVAHGVTLIPELDVPGHANDALKRLCPTRPVSGYPVLNPVSERTFTVLDTLIGELCAVFRASPYIHIGADEVPFAGWGKCRDCAAFLRRHGYTDIKEAYRHFIVRMNDIVRRHGRRTIVWEGFAAEGAVRIPEDVIVQFFDVDYIQPEEALALGHDIINSSWGPLYVVPGYAACPVPMIYQWHPFLFGSSALSATPDALANAPAMAATTAPTTFFSNPLPGRYYPRAKAIPPNREKMLGSMLCSWEILDRNELAGVRRRLAAMSERIWHPEADRPWTDFSQRLEAQDYRLDGLLHPIQQAHRETMPDFAPVTLAVTPFVTELEVSDLQPAAKVRTLAYPRTPAALSFRRRTFPGRFCDLHPELAAAGAALVYFRFALQMTSAGQFNLLLGYDGPVRVWVDRRCVFTDPHGANPARADKVTIPFAAKRGRHQILIALDADGGRAWGIFARIARAIETASATDAGIAVHQPE